MLIVQWHWAVRLIQNHRQAKWAGVLRPPSRTHLEPPNLLVLVHSHQNLISIYHPLNELVGNYYRDLYRWSSNLVQGIVNGYFGCKMQFPVIYRRPVSSGHHAILTHGRFRVRSPARQLIMKAEMQIMNFYSSSFLAVWVDTQTFWMFV